MAQHPTAELDRRKKGGGGKSSNGGQGARRLATPTEGGAGPDLDDLTAPDGGAQSLLYETTRGRVAGYGVNSAGLTIHLDCSAISRIVASVGAEEPHFRSAVSMAMVALNNRISPSTSTGIDQQYLWVSLEKTTKGRTIRPAAAVALSSNTDNDPFDHAGWAFAPTA
ncbi:hypothetical protein LHP98_00585 [Rhodobacter sp. Har01]|uniref:hypothetical protein n=1 Tax=Rhodobacter sp. Har01 TaxID=2883999 RepID=UPI001D0876A5|nr:hypothetical protein [Rhodobacter sp. Har01]MCB6176626.1 hypothetical protein [Rhodobacter sp. Har01]